MNENAKLWVSELRSGRYKQAKQVLHNIKDNSYCCLGVACELAKQAGVAESVRTTCGGIECTGYRTAQSAGGLFTGYLPPSVREWLGLNDDIGQLAHDNGCESLTTLNDKGRSFAYIADVIEQNAEQLFTA
jgi:hypothetical protein